MNEVILTEIIEKMKEIIREQQEIVDRLEKQLPDEIKPTPEYFPPVITYLRELNGTSNCYDNSNTNRELKSDRENDECPASKIW